MTTEIAVNEVFASSNKRFEVVFNELLKITLKYAEQHRDPYVLDLVTRAKAIAASFPAS